MTTRVLPPEEWSKLTGTLLEHAHASLDPDVDRIVVVERDGDILGSAVVARLWHVEAAMISEPARRNVAVGRALLRGIEDQLRILRVQDFQTMTVCRGTKPMGARLGVSSVHLDGEHYAVRVI